MTEPRHPYQPVVVLDRCGSGSGVKHWYCCNENLSWCLMDISDLPECPDDCGCPPCVVCDDMETEPCPNGCNVSAPSAQESAT